MGSCVFRRKSAAASAPSELLEFGTSSRSDRAEFEFLAYWFNPSGNGLFTQLDVVSHWYYCGSCALKLLRPSEWRRASEPGDVLEKLRLTDGALVDIEAAFSAWRADAGESKAVSPNAVQLPAAPMPTPALFSSSVVPADSELRRSSRTR